MFHAGDVYLRSICGVTLKMSFFRKAQKALEKEKVLEKENEKQSNPPENEEVYQRGGKLYFLLSF